MEKNVLVIDTDYSNSTTLYYSKQGKLYWERIFCCNKSGNLTKNIVSSRNEQIDIIPSNTDIERLDIKIRIYSKLLDNEADSLKTYDFILIDTSQRYNSVVLNAIHAEIILTPVMLCQFDMISCLSLQSKIVEAEKISSWGFSSTA